MTARFKGFTLVELLIVIAIIGVLAVVVLIAINPVEQLAKTRDAGRISTVTQLGHAVQAYYTSHATQTNPYPSEGAPDPGWAADLSTTGEISVFPSGIAYTGSPDVCTENDEPGTDATYCYDLDLSGAIPPGAIVYSRLESLNQNNKCTSPDIAFVLFSTADGRGGVVCAADALPGSINPLNSGLFDYK